MKRLIIQAVIKLCAESILISTLIGVVIGIIGYVYKWNSLLAYSNAFFLAGAVIIVAGGLSRMGAGQGWDSFQRLYSESFREMSPGERANFIVDASSPMHLVILGLLSGIMLIVISAIAAYIS